MCLIAFALGLSPRWPLVIAANRDEALDRPAAPLDRWTTVDGHVVVSGRDLRAGGTWLGMTPAGRVAFLTNVREVPATVGRHSRGDLVLKWLAGDHRDPGELCAALGDGAGYSGFNLVVGDLPSGQWAWLGNRPGADGLRFRRLPPGLYGVSNAVLDTPWPKTLALKDALAASLAAQGNEGADALSAPLWSALADTRRAPADQLPHTGVPQALEEALSSAFIDIPARAFGAYGTRCSTVVSAEAQAHDAGGWRVTMEERTPLASTRDDGLRHMAGATVSRWCMDVPPRVSPSAATVG